MTHDPDRDAMEQTSDNRRHMPQGFYDARRTGAMTLVVSVLFVMAIALMFSGSPDNPDAGSKFRAGAPSDAPTRQNQ